MSDPIRQWREDADQREEERARVKRERLRAERRVTEGHEAAALRVHLETRIVSLEQRCSDLEQALVQNMKTVSDIFDDLASQRMTLSGEQRSELREVKVQLAKVGSTLDELRERHTDFKFAREKDLLPPPKLDS